LDQERGRDAPHQAARLGSCRLGLHLRSGRLQPGAGTQAARHVNVSGPVECQLIGRWRIVDARPGRSPVTDQPNSRTTARSRLSCPSTTATTPSLPVDANDFFNSLLVERDLRRSAVRLYCGMLDISGDEL